MTITRHAVTPPQNVTSVSFFAISLQVTVPNPDMKGRKEILSLYLNKITHDDSVDVDKLARRTTGFSGADLENLVNTAAIRAALDGKKKRSKIRSRSIMSTYIYYTLIWNIIIF